MEITLLLAIIAGFFGITTSIVTIIGSYVLFILQKRKSINEKKIEIKTKRLEKLERKALQIAKQIYEVRSIISDSYVSFANKESYKYDIKYHESWELLGSLIRIYFPNLNTFYDNYYESMSFYIATVVEKDPAKVINAYGNFLKSKETLLNALSDEVKLLKQEIDNTLILKGFFD